MFAIHPEGEDKHTDRNRWQLAILLTCCEEGWLSTEMKQFKHSLAGHGIKKAYRSELAISPLLFVQRVRVRDSLNYIPCSKSKRAVGH
jgi:hypothetical protein